MKGMKAHHHLIVPMSLSISLLDSLTQQLNEREVTFVRGSLVHAFEMGKLLAQAKQEVKKQHILWKVYLKDSVPGVSDRKSTRLNSSHRNTSRMPSSA